ncbi:hypothetical protein [Desulfobacula sp.]
MTFLYRTIPEEYAFIMADAKAKNMIECSILTSSGISLLLKRV